jgi:hypothetical protein
VFRCQRSERLSEPSKSSAIFYKAIIKKQTVFNDGVFVCQTSNFDIFSQSEKNNLNQITA